MGWRTIQVTLAGLMVALSALVGGCNDVEQVHDRFQPPAEPWTARRH